ncbi:AAA-domain-containing protein [Tothia fuscella]|uniref:AAA-domain-containing protein n=1 Tax=Tothia fuscella TaxID=1048955 RepID=A0A9P4TXG3_9PEZI|nr:AAA-domain-containing protein [Tothia fuscella]
MPNYNSSKRKFEDFDPNKSDPNDSDFSESAPGPSSNRRRSQKKSSNKGGGGTAGGGGSSRHSNKRQRRRRGSDSSGIVDDEEELSNESFSEEHSEEEPEINPSTGRAVRRAAKKAVTYEESDEEDVEEEVIESEVEEQEQEEDLDGLSRTPQERGSGGKRKSQVVKLKFKNFDSITPKKEAARPKDIQIPMTRPGRNTRSRTASKPPITPLTAVMNTRRSSRLSHDPEPVMQLTSSGKHAEITRPGTMSPPDQVALGRRTRGGKGMAGKQPGKQPSAIMEESMVNTEGDTEPAEEEGEAEDDAPREESEEEEMLLDLVESVEKDAEAEAEATEEADDVEAVEKAEATEAEQIEEQPPKPVSSEDDEDGPVRRSGRNLRSRAAAISGSQSKKRGIDESSDYNPEGEVPADEIISESDENSRRKRPRRATSSQESPARKTRGGRRQSQRLSRRHSSASDESIDPDELAEEAHELQKSKSRQTRSHRQSAIQYDEPRPRRARAEPVNYTITSLQEQTERDLAGVEEAEPARRAQRKNGGMWRSLHSVAGPFGGLGGPRPLYGGAENENDAVGGVDSDSSEDEGPRPQGIGGAVGMTPTSARNPGFPGGKAAAGGANSGGVADLGRVTKEKKALADADPLGVDENVNFEAVGGLEDHVNSLKEMVMMPLLYPELFARQKITPPRGVLFHGPPGTGKTLLARALANSVSIEGKKVTFFIRKGADALSKWVGEAERQLRLLFEEARKSQPSIIFFDEIDGLAPVRSSKQEQIHASIVATLLALMDGMDGRGQVIVIGATNRPDNVDPALRRPGRFDREFYFPLPDAKARRAIIDINIKGWEPPLQPEFVDQVAEITKGYGGADLRALCTEAALNAIQGTYPQIYSSNKKLLIDPTKIKVLPKDFMLSINKIIPSSERTATSRMEPLHQDIAPLLREPLKGIVDLIDEILPTRAKLSALEEAQFDDRNDEFGFEREKMQRDLDRARIFRPRLLIRGLRGMGQQHLASALLHKFEKLFVQSFDMATLMEDTSRSVEAAIIQLFKEVRRHKPSVIFLPNVDVWYDTIGPHAIKTFVSLLRSLPPNEPVLVLGVMELDRADEKPNAAMMRDLFGFSSKNDFKIKRPNQEAREEYFEALVGYVRKRPSEFPDPENRKRRKIEVLPDAPAEAIASAPLTKEELKRQKRADRHTLNQLKMEIGKVMEQIKKKYRRFVTPVIDDARLRHLFDEQDPTVLTTDLTQEQLQAQEIQHPYVLATDRHGVGGIKEVATQKFFYNMDIVTIETRLSNGYYKRYKDFYADIKYLAKDAKNFSDRDRMIKANELVSNVEVDMIAFENQMPSLNSECEAVYLRELARLKQAQPAESTLMGAARFAPQSISTMDTNGPVILGEPVPGAAPFLAPITPVRPVGSAGSSGPNVIEPRTNGSSVPSRHPDEDAHMADSESTTQPDRSAFLLSVAAHSGTNTQQRRNQAAVFQKMIPGSQIDDYQNSASTTTSGQKTTSSNRTSGHSVAPAGGDLRGHTQSTNGSAGDSHYYPPFDHYAAMSGGSQIPDTQENSDKSGQTHAQQQSSGESAKDIVGEFNIPNKSRLLRRDGGKLIIEAEVPSSQHTSSQSQPASSQGGFSVPKLPEHAVAARQLAATANVPATTTTTGPNPPPLNTHSPHAHTSNIVNILNSPAPDPPLLLDETALSDFKSQIVRRTSGCSVEQLEQVMSSLMNVIWSGRGKWNRTALVKEMGEVFNRCIEDIEYMQDILDPSGNSDGRATRGERVGAGEGRGR